jgi:hypothetical protein
MSAASIASLVRKRFFPADETRRRDRPALIAAMRDAGTISCGTDFKGDRDSFEKSRQGL